MSSRTRERFLITGVVQGVGFRPHVFALARDLGLAGFVRNGVAGVTIEVEGDPQALAQFGHRLVEEAPPRAQIAALSREVQEATGDASFRIESSDDQAVGSLTVAADIATCDACLAELFDPADRRFEYPFLNCCHCGPRLTIVTGAPYDRSATTLAGFPLCDDCRREYEDPSNRRFHAQPVACPQCGPRLELLDGEGRSLVVPSPLAVAAEALVNAKIVAIKGLGGFHLACDASSGSAVRALRARKHRDGKPLAVMVRDLAQARTLASLRDVDEELISSAERPIALVDRRADAPLAREVAPDTHLIGLMLPYTPLHHLLLRRVGCPLVMTSGNRSDEPIAFRDDFAQRLAGIPDLILSHDRPIHIRCDDSVARACPTPRSGSSLAGVRSPTLARRSRGFAPLPRRLPAPLAEPTLALGGQLKATFALGVGDRAVVSHHLGDLDDFEAFSAYRECIDHYRRLFRIEPTRVVHDGHPDYASTRVALELEAAGLRRISLQHHRAHAAACLAENGWDSAALAIVLDGAGYGEDSSIWGGEVFAGSLHNLERAGHLRSVRMPGGMRAALEPWRMAQSHCRDAGIAFPGDRPAALEPDAAPGEGASRVVDRLLETGFQAPLTSSAGRLFDAAAWLVGGPSRLAHEGHAAMWLEALASREAPGPGYPVEVVEEGPVLVLDTRPMIRALVSDVEKRLPPPLMARRFHDGLARGLAGACVQLRERCGAEAVALSGGVFVNAVLLEACHHHLVLEGFQVLRHRQVPPNDGGLSFGQLAATAAADARGP